MKELYGISLVISFVVFLSVSTFAQGLVWTPEMQIKVKALGSPRISPDDKRIVYTVNEAVMTVDKSEFVTQLWLATTDGKENFQLTFGDKSSTNPKWSPDGSAIAFTSNRKDNKNNLYVLRLQGGEAEPLTDVKTAVSDFEWSPDGRSIAFTMADAKNEDEEKNDKAKADYRWIDENVKLSRLYVIPLAKDANGKREPRKLTTENYHVNGFNWSPDSRQIVFSHVKSPVANDWPTSDVSIIDLNPGKATPLASTSAAESSPVYSPDGKSIAMIVSDNPPRWAQSGSIHIYPADGGASRSLAGSHDGQPNIFGWSKDGKRIYFSEPKGTMTRLYVVDIAANKISEFNSNDGVIGGLELSPSGNLIAFMAQGPDRAPEVFVSRSDAFAPVQVSRANADLPKLPFGRTEIIRWKSSDGKDIEGLLTYPVNYQAGIKVPLILNIHGGPAGVFQQNYIGGRGVYPLATFAARGYAILRPNPRGSSGYGTEFRRANIKDWGVGDYSDLMTGVDKVIEMGVADADRLGVMGWSYGGYMTSWIITQTKRFKAASSGAPVTNLMSFTGTADIPGFIPDYFGGQPWEVMEVYRKHSPMFNIKGVSTPTLVQHGEADIRVPISQGYELYNALKLQGVPTRMVVFPRQPHGLQEPRMQLAAMQANIEWFEKYLRKGASAQK